MALNLGALIDNRATDLTTFTVKVNGEPLPGIYKVKWIDIFKALNKVSHAEITILDGDPTGQEFALSNEDLLIPGNEIEVFGGYSNEEDLIFKGVIVNQKISMKKEGDSIVCIHCKDASYKMTLVRRSNYYKELSNSQLIEELVGRYSGLSTLAEPTQTIFPEIVQYQVSDWDLMVSRAEKSSMVCLASDGEIKVFKPSISQTPITTLTYGRNMFDFNMEMDARLQYGDIKASSWDLGDQAPLVAEISDVDIPPHGNISGPELASVSESPSLELKHSGRLSQEQLDSWAESQMIKSRFSRIRGTVQFQGTAEIRPGDLVELDGLGDRFNGTSFVSGVRHSLGKGDWVTSVQVGLDPNWHQQNFPVDPMPGSGLNTSITGLQIGVVTQIEGDPDSEERILVRLPLISSEEDGIWSRIATLEAGENRGFVFRPEIGDEVIVGFIEGDPHQAIVLGGLHSSNKPSPIEAKDDNHIKGWVTRSEMKVTFNDEDISLTIETPNGNKIELSDKDGSIAIKDENGNSITLNSDGIALESAKDIILKALNDVSIEGVNSTLKAQANLTAEGNAGAALKSGGSVEVKGSIVQIN